MSQNDMSIANAPGATVRADINSALQALASLNSGTTAPTTTYGNMWWFDTANNLLMQRTEDNTAWITIALKSGSTWTPYFQGSAQGDASTLAKDTDGTLAADSDVKVATQKATKTYADGKVSKTTAGEISAMTEKVTPVDADVILIEDSAASYAKKKVLKSSLTPGVDGVTIELSGTSLQVKDAGVSQAKLKTSTGEVSTASNANLTLPGGEYGFYPQVKHTNSTGQTGTAQIAGSFTTTSYVTNIRIEPGTSETMYAQQRYVTSSGQDFWVFLLVESATGNILAGYAAPDHPMYGNGGDENEVPHPFMGNDMTGKEVVLLQLADARSFQARASRNNSILTIIHAEKKANINAEEPYIPMHSGRFVGNAPEMINVKPAGVKVRKLINK